MRPIGTEQQQCIVEFIKYFFWIPNTSGGSDYGDPVITAAAGAAP
jgi:hypothetical protein